MPFSIIIPVYNVEGYLKQCLDSVINQTHGDWEAICVDDGSTDGSAAILAEYALTDRRLKIVTQTNGGLSAARNTGLRIAEANYVLFLDSDDWLEPNALEIIDNSIMGEDMLCFSGRRYFEETSSFNPADKLPEKKYSTGMDYYNENALVHRDFAFVCVVLRAYKRTFLLENGLKFKEGIYHEDNLFTPLACYHATAVRVINACLYNYRVRANSITTSFNLKRMRDFLNIANVLATFFIPQSGFDKTMIYRAITHHYQVAFMNSPKCNQNEMKQLCDWTSYKTVSRTKMRHRINYQRYRLLSRFHI